MEVAERSLPTIKPTATAPGFCVLCCIAITPQTHIIVLRGVMGATTGSRRCVQAYGIINSMLFLEHMT